MGATKGSKLAGALALVASLLAASCESSDEEPPPDDPSLAQWYGEISVVRDDRIHTKVETGDSGSWTRTVRDETTSVTTHISVSKDGVRKQTIKATIHEFFDGSNGTSSDTCT